MKIWSAKIDGVGNHIFLDDTNQMNEAQVRIAIYYILFETSGNMYKRPLVKLDFMKDDQQVQISVQSLKFCRVYKLLKIE